MGYLVLAYSEEAINHTRLSQFTTVHPRDLSALLSGLEAKGLLASKGQYKSKTYFIDGIEPLAPEDVFGNSQITESSSMITEGSSMITEGSSMITEDSSQITNDSSMIIEEKRAVEPNTRDSYGRVEHFFAEASFVELLGDLEPRFRESLEEIAKEPRTKKRVSPDTMKKIILTVCEGQYVSTRALAELLNRDPVSLRGSYLSTLRAEGKLKPAFPGNPTDPRQSYLTIK